MFFLVFCFVSAFWLFSSFSGCDLSNRGILLFFFMIIMNGNASNECEWVCVVLSSFKQRVLGLGSVE